MEAERAKGRAVLLTTHSMEEADTLCSRIGIMVKGRLCSIGSQSQLKSKHGDGFRLSLTTSPHKDILLSAAWQSHPFEDFR